MSITQEQALEALDLLRSMRAYHPHEMQCFDILRQYIQQSAQAAPQAEQAADMADLKLVLFDLERQVREFIAEYGEANFYTGPVAELSYRLNGREVPGHLVGAVDALRTKIAAATQPQQAKEGGNG